MFIEYFLIEKMHGKYNVKSMSLSGRTLVSGVSEFVTCTATVRNRHMWGTFHLGVFALLDCVQN